MEEIKSFYHNKYNFSNFYTITSKLIQNNKLLTGRCETSELTFKLPKIDCINGDIRVDLPISIGSEESSYRIAILGLEPRDSNSKFNIERTNKFVFGTPFGIENWAETNKYYKCFEDLLKRDDCYLYFTDVVKEYEVKETKGVADNHARKSFWSKAANLENIYFLKTEFEIIKPTHILALGNDTFTFLNQHFGNKVTKVVHPNARQNPITKQNAWDLAKSQIQNSLLRRI